MQGNTVVRLPIGYDEFGKLIDNKLSFVDKSLLIKDIIQDVAEVILITRPRRFGKTLNLSMLHYFFAKQVLGQSTQGLFDHLQIAQEPSCMEHQGKYPVINLTLKDIKYDYYSLAYDSFCQIMSECYMQHEILLSSNKLNDTNKKQFEAVLNRTADTITVQSSLKTLSYYLYQHYGVKAIILIDEYDTPLQSSYIYQYYEEMLGFIRGFLSLALKNNPYLYKAVLTGILRIAKESLFSGLNNIAVYSLFKSEYSQYFGFTEEEVKQLFMQAGIENRLSEARLWYNSYQIGNTVIYNPWSIANCIKQKGACEPYWINTSDNLLVKRLLIQSNKSLKEKCYQLIKGENIEATIDEGFVFSELQNNESAIWSLLCMTGYLKFLSQDITLEGLIHCKLAIPNLEVKGLYRRFIKEWLSNGKGIQWYNEFLERLLNVNIEDFEKDIKYLMLQIASVHDLAREPEVFYQGFLLGLTASLSKADYSIQSNRESGYGRYDIAIIPQDIRKTAILIELKSLNAPKKEEDLEPMLTIAAQDALKQINKLQYITDLHKQGKESICKIGIAFSGKNLKVCYEKENSDH